MAEEAKVTTSGHGWVFPAPGGVARCGGPQMCKACADDLSVAGDLLRHANSAQCIYCGHTGPKTREAALDHASQCQKRPDHKMALCIVALSNRLQSACELLEVPSTPVQREKWVTETRFILSLLDRK